MLVTLGVVLSLLGAPDRGVERADASHRPRPAEAVLGFGFTHTQYSADMGGSAARERVKSRLARVRLPQNQHIMGWGAQNPEPSPGRYDFSSLDRRMELVRATGGTPVITLCCAPDWMKGGEPGATDWSRLEAAPLPEHYADFARLARKVAERYPYVRHFIVWNELKGFYDEAAGRWDHEGYTRLYNLVYREVKKANPRNLVGGPYVVMDSDAADEAPHPSGVTGPWGTLDQRALDVLRYWHEHKVGADFVVVDGPSYTRDDRPLPDAAAAVDKFTAVGRWVRELTGLPLWWAEWYVEPADDADRRDGLSERQRTALHAAALIAMVEGEAVTGFYWNPQRRTGRCPGCLWSGTERSDGGAPLSMLRLLTRFRAAFPPGTAFRTRPRVDVTGEGAASVRALAAPGALLLVNTADHPVTVRVDGATYRLDAYAVRWRH